MPEFLDSYMHVYVHTYICTYMHISPPTSCCVSLPVQEHPPKPDIPWLSIAQWNTCCDLEDLLPVFKGLTSDIVSTPVHCKAGRVEVSLSSSLTLTLSPSPLMYW